jgi:hypothetical protein
MTPRPARASSRSRGLGGHIVRSFVRSFVRSLIGLSVLCFALDSILTEQFASDHKEGERAADDSRRPARGRSTIRVFVCRNLSCVRYVTIRRRLFVIVGGLELLLSGKLDVDEAFSSLARTDGKKSKKNKKK